MTLIGFDSEARPIVELQFLEPKEGITSPSPATWSLVCEVIDRVKAIAMEIEKSQAIDQPEPSSA